MVIRVFIDDVEAHIGRHEIRQYLIVINRTGEKHCPFGGGDALAYRGYQWTISDQQQNDVLTATRQINNGVDEVEARATG